MWSASWGGAGKARQAYDDASHWCPLSSPREAATLGSRGQVSSEQQTFPIAPLGSTGQAPSERQTFPIQVYALSGSDRERAVRGGTTSNAGLTEACSNPGRKHLAGAARESTEE